MISLKDLCMMVIVKSKKPSVMASLLKNSDHNCTFGTETSNNNKDVGVPRAVFIPHANSLPFEERRVSLEEPVKIGRFVCRGLPCPTNTIFDCRVLSRHHATLYYDKGHFYLVDNQSSNGTFINNDRCSFTKEPHEVFSGDVVQFGISVVESTNSAEKTTYPPVVALLKLFHPDGMEAKLHLNDIYQLNNYLQEAAQREVSLEARQRSLQECLERTRAEAQASWELFVGEQRLMMRVRALEALVAAGKSPDHHHVAQLLTDKKNYQEVALESLRTAHEQRLALEESLERRGREAAALHTHNCALRLAADHALAELQKLASRCDRKICAARLAVSTAEERESTLRKRLPLTYSVQNGEAKMLVLSVDSNKVLDSKRVSSLEDAIRALPDYIKLLLPQHLLNKMKAGVEYANILRVMAGLNEEIRALRERVTAANSELDQLRHVRDELLAARDAAPEEAAHVAGLRAAVGDLQEANLAEIKRLATSAAEMQAELAFRPSRADVDDLTAVVGGLRADLLAKDALLERLLARDPGRAGVDKAVETAPPDESMDTGHITAQIDEMFHLDYDDDESDSTAIETNDAEPAAERARLDDDERVQAHLRNGSLLALQEELVRAKEGWAAAADERARLAARLARLQAAPRPWARAALALAALLAALYVALAPHLA
ncbi:unnamed protein product [Leptidea sinapis]|uniref:FHA domain-containing protein n=1 Tax=Leptidea sinapis TaxID=189913 RepID=A0A5E4PNJ9_9NEOP|nr:unnamed protein product [Leptidea sinapis]